MPCQFETSVLRQASCNYSYTLSKERFLLCECNVSCIRSRRGEDETRAIFYLLDNFSDQLACLVVVTDEPTYSYLYTYNTCNKVKKFEIILDLLPTSFSEIVFNLSNSLESKICKRFFLTKSRSIYSYLIKPEWIDLSISISTS